MINERLYGKHGAREINVLCPLVPTVKSFCQKAPTVVAVKIRLDDCLIPREYRWFLCL